MRIVTIPKRNGKLRTIYVPSKEEAEFSRHWIGHIEYALWQQPHVEVLHGFMPGRSPVTNAMAHVGFHYTLSFDLKDFFDSVKPEHVIAELSKWIGLHQSGGLMDSCFFDGSARQGLPSSPAIANLAASPMDAMLMSRRARSRFGWNFTYTRYADDLTFSFNHESVGKMLMRIVPRTAELCGFVINPAKTHLQCSANGRRIITGVAVDDSSIHSTREVKRRIRAMEHQLEKGIRPRGRKRLLERIEEAKRRGSFTNLGHLMRNGHAGLVEWSKLKIPADFTTSQKKPMHAALVSPQSVQPAQNTQTRLVNAVRRFIFDAP